MCTSSDLEIVRDVGKNLVTRISNATQNYNKILERIKCPKIQNCINKLRYPI